MRALLPEPADDVDIHAWYAAEWLEPGGLRANFVSSVDGAATADGLSAGLQTPGDNAIFAALRDLADVVLVGAGTARAEGYRPTDLGPARTAKRLDFGLPAELPTALISRRLLLDPASALFTDTSPTARTIVLTCSDTDDAVRQALAAVADVVICGDDEVDLGVAKAALAELGLTRVLCEGGPSLFADLARAGVVDELCLSVTPMLAGPGARRIVAGDTWDGQGAAALQLVGLLEEDGALFGRYRRPAELRESAR